MSVVGIGAGVGAYQAYKATFGSPFKAAEELSPATPVFTDGEKWVGLKVRT